MNNFHHFHSIICSSDRLHIKNPNETINRQHTTLILYLTIHSPHIPPYPYQGTIEVQTVEYQKSKNPSDKQKRIAEKGYMLHGTTVCNQQWCSIDITRVSTSRQCMRKSPGPEVHGEVLLQRGSGVPRDVAHFEPDRNTLNPTCATVFYLIDHL